MLRKQLKLKEALLQSS
uniref:Uncharacterized protein n=1 Tax=Arundo donax TaxID=35708 RepID=A0A0A9BUE7_ARUDO